MNQSVCLSSRTLSLYTFVMPACFDLITFPERAVRSCRIPVNPPIAPGGGISTGRVLLLFYLPVSLTVPAISPVREQWECRRIHIHGRAVAASSLDAARPVRVADGTVTSVSARDAARDKGRSTAPSGPVPRCAFAPRRRDDARDHARSRATS